MDWANVLRQAQHERSGSVRSHDALAVRFALLVTALTLGGCASLGVQPWERDVLARKSMQLDTHPLITAADSHIYFSKEGASGGRSFEGGGCGCN